MNGPLCTMIFADAAQGDVSLAGNPVSQESGLRVSLVAMQAGRAASSYAATGVGGTQPW